MNKVSRKNSATLLELLIALGLFSVIVLALSSVEIASRSHVLAGQRRAEITNEVSYVLEHMTKRLSLAMYDAQGIEWPKTEVVDLNAPPVQRVEYYKQCPTAGPAPAGYIDDVFRFFVDDNPADGKLQEYTWHSNNSMKSDGDHLNYYHYKTGIQDGAYSSQLSFYPYVNTCDQQINILSNKLIDVQVCYCHSDRVFDITQNPNAQCVCDPAAKDNFLTITATGCWDPSKSGLAGDTCGTKLNPTITMTTSVPLPSVSSN